MNKEKLNILLIEDNEDHAELVQRCFELNNMSAEIYRIKDGEEALDYLLRYKLAGGENIFYPNLILLDLRLPKIDGLTILKEFKKSERHREIPVVVLTSSDSEIDIKNAFLNKASSYLVKPLDNAKLSQIITDLKTNFQNVNKNHFIH